MNRAQPNPVVQTQPDEPETEATVTADQRTAATAPPPEDKNHRVALLSSITTSPVMGSGMTAFLPRDMMQAIEFSKMMASGNFVPPHLRNRPGDCLAVVFQAVRWRADPFAVASKTYFVNDRMAYEAQLVNAVLNTSNVLDGRLQITWKGKIGTPDFECIVRGRIKGDEEVHELLQEFATIKTKNSPLWNSSPRIQLGYYTSRGWGRLYTPEVMLGIYTPDEIEDGMGADAHVVGQQIIEPRTYSMPSRPTLEATREELERARQEDYERSRQFRATMADTGGQTDAAEVSDEQDHGAAGQPEMGADQGEDGARRSETAEGTSKKPWFQDLAPADVRARLIKDLTKIGDLKALDAFDGDNAAALAWLQALDAGEYDKVHKAAQGKRVALTPRQK